MKRIILTIALLLFASVAWGMEVTLEWNSVERAESYKVYFGTTSKVYLAPKYSKGLTERTITIDQLNDDSKFYFAVTAYNTYGETAYSKEVDIIIEGCRLPPPEGIIGITKTTSNYDGGYTIENDIAGQKLTVTYPDGKIAVTDYVAGTITTYPTDGGEPVVTQLPQ